MTQKPGNFRVLALAALWAALAPPAGAAAAPAPPSPEKWRYSLLEPTPHALMREFSTDRPDVTESPYTVDAGHFQVELSLVEYARDDASGERFEEFAVLLSNIKVGLLNNLDLQLVVDPYIHQRLRASGGGTGHTDGFGAVQLRAKLNLLGNDEGDVAAAVLPFVQFPTADHDIGGVDHVEVGVILPLAVALPDNWSLGLMAEIDFLRNADDDGYGSAFVHTAALGHPIAGNLSGFIEYVGAAPHNLGIGYVAQLGGGLTYAIGADVQLDGAIYFGISDDADDFTALVGLSFRL